MNSKKVKKLRKVMRATKIQKPDADISKSAQRRLKKLIVSGVISICIFLCNICFADNIHIPAFGMKPKEFKKVMESHGFQVEYDINRIDGDTFAYIEFRGTEYRLHTLRSVSLDELERIKTVFMEGDK